MPDEVTLAGSPCTAKVRNPWAVLGLTLITFGIYSLFWWYSINREMRDFGRVQAVEGLGEHPGLSTAAFSGLTIFTLYISLVWTVVTTTRRVRRAQRAAGHSRELNGWISAALWIFTLTIGGMVYTQSELNKVWRAQGPGGQAAGDTNEEIEWAPSSTLRIEDPEEWPDEHPATWDTITRRAYKKRYGKPPGA